MHKLIKIVNRLKITKTTVQTHKKLILPQKNLATKSSYNKSKSNNNSKYKKSSTSKQEKMGKSIKITLSKMKMS